LAGRVECVVESIEAESEGCRIIVSRTSERDIKIRGLEILVDGNFAANLQFGTSFEGTVACGPHRVTATNRMFSRSLDFEASAGKPSRFVATCVPLGGLWLLVAMMGTVAYKVRLERVE
jgi:hypothetical protein